MEFKKTTGLNDEAKMIREEVFVKEQGFNNEFDEIDGKAHHLVFYYEKIPVATARYYKEGDFYIIGRVAILKEYRGKKLGGLILKILEDEIRKDGGNKIKLSAQVRVKEFYEKGGYRTGGGIYYDEYCEHITMIKEIKR